MVESILAKKKTAGATHALIDIPLGPSTKIRTQHEAEQLSNLFYRVAEVIGLQIDVVTTDARGPIGCGIGPRLEALDVLAVLGRQTDAPTDLREKSLYLAARILERTGRVHDAHGYRTAQEALDSGRAEATFRAMIAAQGEREMPAAARFTTTVESSQDGRIGAIDCLRINRLAKLAGSPAHPSAGLRCQRKVGEVVARGEPLFEIHAQSEAQLKIAAQYASSELDKIVHFGY